MKKQTVIYLSIMLLIARFMSEAAQAQVSHPIFVVVGNLIRADESVGMQNLVVTATNETRAIQHAVQLRTQAETYAVPFVAIDENPVVATGDVLKIEVQTFTGERLGVADHAVTPEEMEKAKAVIDVELRNAELAQEQAAAADDASHPVFVVAGEVIGKDGGKAENGLAVVVTNETQATIRETQTGLDTREGSYVVSFVAEDDKPVVAVDDVIKVEIKLQDGSRLGDATHTITEADISAAKVVINVEFTGITLGPLTQIEFAAQPNAEMTAGEVLQFRVVGSDADSNQTEVAGDELLWSMTGGIGTINQTGEFTAKTVGTGTIKATLLSNAALIAESREISILAGAAKDVKVESATLSLNSIR